MRRVAPTSAAYDRRALERLRGKFTEATYRNKSGSRRYKLFLPATGRGETLPLIVMLHGCTQSPDDFAVATGMNALAERHRFAVAYPAQSVSANRSRCWNWFRVSDQIRGRGEPDIIAGLTRHLVRAYRLDAKRVYVAGLSAGAAMATILARTYPEIYAAMGAHSGLPYAAAHDVASAFAAMRGEQTGRHRRDEIGSRTPTIVIHGDCDRIVHPCNAQGLFDQFLDRRHREAPTIERRVIDGLTGGRSSTHTVLRNADGVAVMEHWLVHGGGHAWFGGDPRSKHADAAGPDASREMLRFFLTHRLEQLEP